MQIKQIAAQINNFYNAFIKLSEDPIRAQRQLNAVNDVIQKEIRMNKSVHKKSLKKYHEVVGSKITEAKEITKKAISVSLESGNIEQITASMETEFKKAVNVPYTPINFEQGTKDNPIDSELSEVYGDIINALPTKLVAKNAEIKTAKDNAAEKRKKAKNDEEQGKIQLSLDNELESISDKFQNDVRNEVTNLRKKTFKNLKKLISENNLPYAEAQRQVLRDIEARLDKIDEKIQIATKIVAENHEKDTTDSVINALKGEVESDFLEVFSDNKDSFEKNVEEQKNELLRTFKQDLNARKNQISNIANAEAEEEVKTQHLVNLYEEVAESACNRQRNENDDNWKKVADEIKIANEEKFRKTQQQINKQILRAEADENTTVASFSTNPDKEESESENFSLDPKKEYHLSENVTLKVNESRGQFEFTGYWSESHKTQKLSNKKPILHVEMFDLMGGFTRSLINDVFDARDKTEKRELMTEMVESVGTLVGLAGHGMPFEVHCSDPKMKAEFTSELGSMGMWVIGQSLSFSAITAVNHPKENNKKSSKAGEVVKTTLAVVAGFVGGNPLPQIVGAGMKFNEEKKLAEAEDKYKDKYTEARKKALMNNSDIATDKFDKRSFLP